MELVLQQSHSPESRYSFAQTNGSFDSVDFEENGLLFIIIYVIMLRHQATNSGTKITNM